MIDVDMTDHETTGWIIVLTMELVGEETIDSYECQLEYYSHQTNEQHVRYYWIPYELLKYSMSWCSGHCQSQYEMEKCDRALQ